METIKQKMDRDVFGDNAELIEIANRIQRQMMENFCLSRDPTTAYTGSWLPNQVAVGVDYASESPRNAQATGDARYAGLVTGNGAGGVIGGGAGGGGLDPRYFGGVTRKPGAAPVEWMMYEDGVRPAIRDDRFTRAEIDDARKAAADAERARIMAALETCRPTDQPYTKLEWRYEERGKRDLWTKIMLALGQPVKEGE